MILYRTLHTVTHRYMPLHTVTGLVKEIEALEERMAELLLNKAERQQRRAAA